LRVSELPTPSVLVNLDILRVNVREMADLCRTHGKELWPMVKTHKSTAIARMQH
jgi:D-serine deaminase-like pyridoxal phosphate-dependent protein